MKISYSTCTDWTEVRTTTVDFRLPEVGQTRVVAPMSALSDKWIRFVRQKLWPEIIVNC